MLSNVSRTVSSYFELYVVTIWNGPKSSVDKIFLFYLFFQCFKSTLMAVGSKDP